MEQEEVLSKVEIVGTGKTPAQDALPPAAELLIGKVVDGRYEILSIIGSGGIGVVYRARHLELKKIVALKILQANGLTDAREIARFQMEARAASLLNHPNIGMVREYGLEAGSFPYIVMDFVEGVPLARLIKEQALDTATALQIARGLCLGLAHAHEHGVIHRDIKPENILLSNNPDGSPQPVIVDFGLARSCLDSQSRTRLTRTGEVFGTPAYMSPEQSLGYPVDERADLYALGVIMYEMLSGARPFSSENPLTLMMKHISTPPPPMADLPAEIQAIVMKALAKDPNLRWESAVALKAAIENVAADRQVVNLPEWAYAKTLALRGLAWGIDTLILTLPALVIVLAFSKVLTAALALAPMFDQIMPGMALLFATDSAPGSLTVFFLGLMITTFNYLYHAILESSQWQGTLGKRWLGLTVSSRNFKRLTFREATIRHWSKMVNLLPFAFLSKVMLPASCALVLGGTTIHLRGNLFLGLAIVAVVAFAMRKLYQMPHDFAAKSMVVPGGRKSPAARRNQ